MRYPSILLASAALLAAVSVSAQTAAPGTTSPHSSGDWGKEGPEGVKSRAEKLFQKLLDAAREGVAYKVMKGDTVVKDGKATYLKTPDFEVDVNNRVIGGSPAAAFSAGLGLNSPGRTIGGKNHSANDLVYTTQALYEMADQDEAAVFIAHEIGHLALGHAKILEDRKKALIDQLYSKWEVSHTVPDDADAAAKQFFKDMAGEMQTELAKSQQPLEDEADAYGRQLALQAKLSSLDSAENAFKRAQDWLWALKLDISDPNHGGTVADRAQVSAKWAAGKRKDKKDAEDAARKKKCADQGMSCE